MVRGDDTGTEKEGRPVRDEVLLGYSDRLDAFFLRDYWPVRAVRDSFLPGAKRRRRIGSERIGRAKMSDEIRQIITLANDMEARAMRIRKHLEDDGSFRKRDEIGGCLGMAFCCALVFGLVVMMCWVADK